MEDDDPEARVDELERQLAQPRAVGAQHGSAALVALWGQSAVTLPTSSRFTPAVSIRNK